MISPAFAPQTDRPPPTDSAAIFKAPALRDHHALPAANDDAAELVSVDEGNPLYVVTAGLAIFFAITAFIVALG